MTAQWPFDWNDRVAGKNCEMCGERSPETDDYGIRIYQSPTVDAVLQRANIQRGYTLVIWRGRHVIEPFELSSEESTGFWQEVMKVGKALAHFYRPLKMNYELLGNTVPHLHMHILPRYEIDPAPGKPFPLLPQDGNEAKSDNEILSADAKGLRTLLH